VAQVHRHPSGGGSPIININFHINKVEKEADTDHLVSKARSELERLNMRSIGYLRGGALGR
jgi:hypothetical protein